MQWRRLVLELVLVCWAGSQVALAGVAAPRTASRRRIPRSHADRKFRSSAWEELDFNSVGQHDKLEERKDLGTKATIYGITASSITYAGIIIGFVILGFETNKLRELQRELYVNVANAARVVTDIDNSV